VINALVPDRHDGRPESPLSVDDVRLLPGSADALRRLRGAGFLLVGVSNQPAAAKGKVPLETLLAVQDRILELLREAGVVPDAFRICFHHPDGTDPALTGACDCRKPRPGMLLAAAEDLDVDLGASWMVGDTDSDVEAGSAAGCRTALVEAPGSAHKRSGRIEADVRAPSLEAAVAAILDRQVV
jgi:D-glycero-D-manno-heptose 1,7-bisphosphate phosphatase